MVLMHAELATCGAAVTVASLVVSNGYVIVVTLDQILVHMHSCMTLLAALAYIQ